jgi:DNA polymerase-1
MEKLVLIDGHSILNRAYYGVPFLSNSEGFPTNAIYGFLNILFKILEEEQPKYLAVAFDVHAPTFRHEMFEGYKATRKPMPEDLREQVPVMKEVLQAMGIAIVEQAGLEADDILGTLARQGEALGLEVALVSGDRDLLQIATDRIKIRIPKTKVGGTQIEDYFAADVLMTYHVTPEQFIELKALMGDASDNIPGVPKVGEKTAMALMEEYGSIDEIYSHLEDITKKSIQQSLRENRHLADLSKELATIKTDCELPVKFNDMEAGNYGTKEAIAICKRLGFNNLISRLKTKEAQANSVFEWVDGVAEQAYKQVALPPENGENTSNRDFDQDISNPEFTLKSLEASFQMEQDPDKIVDLLEKTADEQYKKQPLGLMMLTHKHQLYGFALSLSEGETIFCPLQAEDISSPLQTEEIDDENITFSQEAEGQLSLFPQSGATKEQVREQSSPILPASASSEPVNKQNQPSATGQSTAYQAILQALHHLSELREQIAVFDIKPLYDFLQKDQTETYFDILIGAYLINSLKNDYTWEDIGEEYLHLTLPTYQSLFGKVTWADIWKELDKHLETVKTYVCYGAYTALCAAPKIAAKLEQTGMAHLMREIEMPLTLVLYDMERIGVMVRPQELKTYSKDLTKGIEALERAIYEQAGEQFNISSPKQLGVILFEKLHLPSGKKTKTGYSTAVDVLEKLSADYPIVKDILEYRTLTKLKSTYAEGLTTYIGEDCRIHSSFNQTITATGRISSTEPNLQNIPIRTQLGRQIRKVFVPKEGCILADADYSQIELRIMAHMSGDEQLIEAYRTSMDIHRMTAAKVFHTPFEEVTPEQRRNAKAVNFGIIYGISAFGLSQDLSISRKEADGYIQQYFATYPKIKAFLDEQVAMAKQKGYVTTMFGRRRPIPELSSSNHMQKAFGERVAMNSPIQGTAADIMKIAMIRVWKALRDGGFKSKLILQVHDELLVETILAEEEKIKQLLADNMRQAADLDVPLEVDLHTGNNWYEAK